MDGVGLGKVGRSYYQNFTNRHSHILSAKKGRRFALNRSEWAHPGYLEQMYDRIFDIFVHANVAHEVEEPVAFDIQGNQLPVGSLTQYSLLSDIVIDFPTHILFGDKMGVNTNQKTDGQTDSIKYLIPKDMEASINSSIFDHRATILPIIAATGEAIVLVIVFQSKSEFVDPL